jgi:hypothetical protein
MDKIIIIIIIINRLFPKPYTYNINRVIRYYYILYVAAQSFQIAFVS